MRAWLVPKLQRCDATRYHLAPPVRLLQVAASAHPTSVAADGMCIHRRLPRLAQPQRHRLWLHRLLHDGHQLLAELTQVSLDAQGGCECLQYPGRVVLAPVEAPVDARLKAAA